MATKIDEGSGTRGAVQPYQPQTGQLMKADSGGNLQTFQTGEVQSQALAAYEEARVKGRMALAQYRRRDWETVRQRIQHDCERPRFAQAAWFKIPKGKTAAGGQNYIEGFTIRFAEEVLRTAGNLEVSSRVVAESRAARLISVLVLDLESNSSDSREINIDKTVERNEVKAGQEVLGERTNAYGKKVFVVVATEDELLAKQNSAISKAKRTLILEMVPADIKDEAREWIQAAQLKAANHDPDAEKRKMIDAFKAIAVTAQMLGDYLGHPLDIVTTEELVDLRQLYNAIKDGRTTWAKTMADDAEFTPTSAPPKSLAAAGAAQKPAPTPPAAATAAVGGTTATPAPKEETPEEKYERESREKYEAELARVAPSGVEELKAAPPLEPKPHPLTPDTEGAALARAYVDRFKNCTTLPELAAVATEATKDSRLNAEWKGTVAGRYAMRKVELTKGGAK